MLPSTRRCERSGTTRGAEIPSLLQFPLEEFEVSESGVEGHEDNAEEAGYPLASDSDEQEWIAQALK